MESQQLPHLCFLPFPTSCPCPLMAFVLVTQTTWHEKPRLLVSSRHADAHTSITTQRCFSQPTLFKELNPFSAEPSPAFLHWRVSRAPQWCTWVFIDFSPPSPKQTPLPRTPPETKVSSQCSPHRLDAAHKTYYVVLKSTLRHRIGNGTHTTHLTTKVAGRPRSMKDGQVKFDESTAGLKLPSTRGRVCGKMTSDIAWCFVRKKNRQHEKCCRVKKNHAQPFI